jgi:hypothetical protein
MNCGPNRLPCPRGQSDRFAALRGRKMDTKGLNEFTTRVLLSLVTDLVDAKESVQRIEVQIAALAKEYGVPLVVSPELAR